MKHILSLEEAAMMNPQTKKQMKKLQKQSGASAGSKKSSKDKTTTITNINKADTYGPKNESLLRDKSKKQMEDLNRTIKAAGGDIQDIVKKGEDKKEDKMPNSMYMDNPFDTKRTSIETIENFMKHGAHDKSIAMKSKDPKNIKKLNKQFIMKESIEDSLRTMNAHFQTYILPNLTEEEQEIVKKLDTIIFKYNYDNETSVRLSFRTPGNKEDVYQLILVNVSYPIYKDMVKIVEKFKLVSDYDNKNKLYLNIYYKNKKQNRMNSNRRINESSYTDFLTSYGRMIDECIFKLRKMNKMFDKVSDSETFDFDKFSESIEKAMKSYDDNVSEMIDHWVNVSSDIDVNDIARFALDNQDTFGTEPQMVLYAIDDAYDVYESLLKGGLNEGKRSRSESHPLDDLKANFRSWEVDCDDEKSAEELFDILQDRHPDVDGEKLRKMAYDWVGCEFVKESINEAKKTSKKKDRDFIPYKPLRNLKHFHEIAYDGDTTKKSNVNDDSWIKGTEDDFKRPMFKNLPDTTIRPSYDVLRTGKMITLFGRESRVIGIKNGELTVDVMGKNDEHEIVKYDMNDVMRELKKNKKKDKKDKKSKKDE